MDNNGVQLVGGPCGQHGPYTFYRAFRYTKNGVKRVVTLSEFFFVKLWIDSDLVCIGELQLLWMDKNSEQFLSSLRLYFLPENTPEGRTDHGEDEVLAISEKVVLRVEDLITWITMDAEWTWGRLGKCENDLRSVKKEDDSLDSCHASQGIDEPECSKTSAPSVVVLSYPRYCRYRAMMKRLEGVENDYLKFKVVSALGGFVVASRNTRILFCRDTFEYPDLEGHEMLCNHLAPKLKGRPRGRRKKRSLSPESESNESEESVVAGVVTGKGKLTTEGGRNGLRCSETISRRSTRLESSEEKLFLKELYGFMKQNRTPISRIPQLGYKELDLYGFYTKVQKLGGYDYVMANRLWKSIFDDLTGNHSSSSAATIIRRHYERFLLSYERHTKGEEDKPLPISERRRLKSKSGSISDQEKSDGGSSRSETATPVPTPEANQDSCSSTSSMYPSCTSQSASDNSNIAQQNNKSDAGKTMSLRSVRVKPERLKTRSESNDEECKPQRSKTSEPVMSAVAPIVQKVNPEKSLSPVEGKENTSSADVEDSNPTDVISMHRESPKSNLEQCYKNTFGFEVKKQKLDILKEGGLEVTPITTTTATTPTYPNISRPSVIQQTNAPTDTIVVTPDTYYMPPPPPLPKRTAATTLPILPRKTRQPKYTNNGEPLPPKILQSSSIYSYSEKTVYGNPKELVSTQVRPSAVKPDLLDLRMGGSQKPVVQIMRLDQEEQRRPPLPLIDGTKIGSNLEITIIAPNKTQNHFKQHSTATVKPRLPQKRTLKDNYASTKFPKTEDLNKRQSFLRNNGVEITVPKPIQKTDDINVFNPTNLPHMFPTGYVQNHHHQQTSKTAPPYHHFPLLNLNPLFCSPLQSVYGNGPTAPVLPMPTPEQLQVYQEFMSRRFPFPFPEGGSIGMEGNYKK